MLQILVVTVHASHCNVVPAEFYTSVDKLWPFFLFERAEQSQSHSNALMSLRLSAIIKIPNTFPFHPIADAFAVSHEHRTLARTHTQTYTYRQWLQHVRINRWNVNISFFFILWIIVRTLEFSPVFLDGYNLVACRSNNEFSYRFQWRNSTAIGAIGVGVGREWNIAHAHDTQKELKLRK